MVFIAEVRCRSVLGKSRIYGVDYSINPYIGCEHGCAYCFARFMAKHAYRGFEWGQFVNVKLNAPKVLARELASAKKGLVLLSSVTDPYQPLEARYNLTRRILRLLSRYSFPTSILTKSSLVLRDVEALKSLHGCEVGFTIVTLEEKVREAFEPKSPPIKDRLKALWTLHENKVETYAFIGPLLPYLTEESLEELIKEFLDVKVSRIMVDKLNIKAGNWRKIKEALRLHYPELIPKYIEVLFKPNDYYDRIRLKILRLCKQNNLPLDLCY